MDTSNLNRELAAFDAEVDRFESDYETKADGKAGIQKGMDSVRSLFNRDADGKGHGDDQFKNIANTQHGLEQIKADVQSGRLDAQQAQQALAQLRQNFAGEADRVGQAQAGNARVGQAVHGAGRIAAVGAAGIAGTVAGGGVNVLTGAAAAVAAGNAYDALTVGAGAADKKLGNGGNADIAPRLNTNQSVGGLAAGALDGQKVEAKDVVQAGVGTALDAVSGGFAGQGIKAARAGIATAQGTSQVAQAAATASVKTGLQQSAATLGVQTVGTAIDPSLSTEQKGTQIVQQGKDTITQLPGQLVFGAASGAAGAVVKPANKLLDGAAQVGIDAASNLGEASAGNVLAGKGAALSAEQMATAAVLGTSGAMHNIVQRGPQDGAAHTPVSDQELRELHQLPTPDLDALLGNHKKDSMAQTMLAGGIDSTLRAIDARAGAIVMQGDAASTTQPALPPSTPSNQKALPGSRQYRVFTNDPRPEVRGQPNRFHGTQVRTVDVYAPGTQPRDELRRNAAFNLGGNTPTYGALQSGDLAKVLDKTHTVVLRDQPDDFARALSTVDPNHGGIAGSAYWGNVVNGGRFASDATPPLGAERQLNLQGVAPTLAGQSFQVSRDLGQAELGGYNTNTAGEGVASLYRSLGFEVAPEAIGVVDPGLRFNGADGGNHSLMRYHIRRDLTDGQVPSPSRFAQGEAQQQPFAAGHAIAVSSAEGHAVPPNHRLPDGPSDPADAATFGKPMMKGVFESVAPRPDADGNLKEAAWDVEVWRMQDMPQGLKNTVASNLQRNYPLVYDPDAPVWDIANKIRIPDTRMFLIMSQTDPQTLSSVAFSLNQGNHAEPLEGYAYLGNFSAPPALRGSGGKLLELAQPYLEQQGIHSLAYVTTDKRNNALRYASQGAQLTLNKDTDKLEMYESLRPKPFEAAGAVTQALAGDIDAPLFYDTIEPLLEEGKTLRLQRGRDADGSRTNTLWIYPNEPSGGLGPQPPQPPQPPQGPQGSNGPDAPDAPNNSNASAVVDHAEATERHNAARTSATITSSQDVPSFDQLERSDLQLGLGNQLREFHRDWKLLPEIASLSYRQHVTEPVKSFVNDTLIEPAAQSALGQAVGRQRDRVTSSVTQAKMLFDQSPPGRLYSRTFGRAFNSLDQHVVRNPAVWKGVDGVAKQMSNAIKIGGVATFAANRIMAGNGTLITGTAVSGDANAPREAIEAARSGNLPKGMTFHYQYAPLPGVPAARAITTVGAKDGIFVPPATGAGQVGTASPWIGFKPNGTNPGSKEIVGTASALAALGDVEASYNIGTTNFNLGLKAFGLAGRVGANVPRFEARNDPVPGAQNPFDVRAILSFDPLHVGATGTVNLGPIAVTVERPRIPVTVKGAVGSSNADNWFDPFAPGEKSNFKPVFSPVSTTYDPEAADMTAIQALLEQRDDIDPR